MTPEQIATMTCCLMIKKPQSAPQIGPPAPYRFAEFRDRIISAFCRNKSRLRNHPCKILAIYYNLPTWSPPSFLGTAALLKSVRKCRKIPRVLISSLSAKYSKTCQYEISNIDLHPCLRNNPECH